MPGNLLLEKLFRAQRDPEQDPKKPGDDKEKLYIGMSVSLGPSITYVSRDVVTFCQYGRYSYKIVVHVLLATAPFPPRILTL